MAHEYGLVLSQLSVPGHGAEQSTPEKPPVHAWHWRELPVAWSHVTAPTQAPCSHVCVHVGPKKPALQPLGQAVTAPFEPQRAAPSQLLAAHGSVQLEP
jgi:hypothetical protein